MKCNGFDLSRGETVEIGFTETIQSMDPLLSGVQADEVFVAPGWIDLQVNGFGGVDFNSPTASSEQIAASLQRMFSTGTTRLFPTVITGAPQLMRDALHNLSQAKKTMPAIEGLHME